MRYYVYILLNDKFEGNYNNKYCEINYRPFYVGKGDFQTKNKSQRHLFHYKEIKNNPGKHTNKHKYNTIKQLIGEGYKPNFVIVYKNDDEKKVLDVEFELIKFYGKQIDGGILTNITDGGVGGDVFKYVEGLKERLKKINSERWSGENNPNYNRKKEETFSHKYKQKNGHHWNKGKIRSDYTKEKYRESRYNNLPLVEMICPVTNEVVDKLKTLDIIKKYDLTPGLLYRCLNEGGKHKGYYWKYEKKELVLSKTKRPDYIKPEKTIKKVKKIYFKQNIENQNEIVFDNIKEASKKTGFCVEVIRRKCRCNNTDSSVFRYENDVYRFDIKNGVKVKIKSIDENGFEKIYESATDAAKDNNGANVSAIIQVCRGKRKKHKNLIFKYV